MRALHRLVAIAVVVAACGTSAGTPTPSPSEQPSTSPSAGPTGTPAPSASPAPTLGPGAYAVTVSDRLRVRSQPRVADDSIRYEPLLPIGTELLVLSGPVEASGYVWWEVEPVSFDIVGATTGWVAMADHNGDPWIAVAPGGGTGAALAKADVARAPADPDAARSTSRSVNAFGLDLYRQLLRDGTLETDANAVFSPASIALALAMARAGARGDTAAEMDDVLHTAGWEDLAGGLNAIDQALAERNARWDDYDGTTREVALRIANAAFGQRDWPIEPAYLEAIAEAFGSGLRLVDFIADPEAARQTINAWVERRTAGRIPELLAEGDVQDSARLYLVNAVYLKAEWEDWFRIGDTAPAPFTRLDGSRVDVPTMQRYAGHSYPIPRATGTGWQAVELRYRAPVDGSPLAMDLILPDDLRSFEATFDEATLASIIGALDAERASFGEDQCPSSPDAGCYPYDVQLFMPKFSIESRAKLANPLIALGMASAFDPARADLTGINPDEPLYISKVIHQANIDVDEKGTEAAAATAVGVDTGGGPSPLEEFTVRLDRPFLYVLRDVETGVVLFMGRVVDPSVTR
jgi:serpin B